MKISTFLILIVLSGCAQEEYRFHCAYNDGYLIGSPIDYWGEAEILALFDPEKNHEIYVLAQEKYQHSKSITKPGDISGLEKNEQREIVSRALSAAKKHGHWEIIYSAFSENKTSQHQIISGAYNDALDIFRGQHGRGLVVASTSPRISHCGYKNLHDEFFEVLLMATRKKLLTMVLI